MRIISVDNRSHFLHNEFMAGFFDFIKKPNSDGQKPQVTQVTTQTQTVQSAPQPYSGIGATPGGGTPYSGIGSPPGGGEPYSGIGTPPVKQQETTVTEIHQVSSNAQQPSSVAPSVQTPSDPKLPPRAEKDLKPETNKEVKPETDKEMDKKETKKDDDKKTDEQKAADLVVKFSDRSKAVIATAQGKAKELKSPFVESEHLLYALISDNDISALFTKLKVQIPTFQEEVKKLYKPGTSTKDPEPSPQVKKILTNSLSISEKAKNEHVEPEHILSALLEEGESAAARILTTVQVTKEAVDKEILEKSVTEKSKTPEELKKEELDLMTHLTQRSNRVFLSAQTKAKELKNQFIDSEHLLHGLLADTEIYNYFTEAKLQPQIIEEELTKIYKKETFDKPPQISPRIKRILDNSLVVARKLGFEFISPEHLLLALYEEGEGAGARVLAKLGLKKEDLNKKITGKKEGLSEDIKSTGQTKKSALQEYTIDLTAKAAQGLLDPVVERSEVIERVIHILSRRNKNNPALVGEAGVGKTAVVEGLANKIVSKEVPEPLLNKRILQLDLMGILAGASHRGEFEERMKNLIEEVKSSQGQIILFIDEIHNIVGAGSSGEGSMDASNFLKPALARGEIQLIGATTLTEYRKYVEKDPALERRFQPVLTPEPTEEQAIKMLQATKDKYEAFHRVTIPLEVIEAAVKFSKRYVGDRFLPDKAVDLIDEAASAVRLPLISLPEEIKSLETRVAELSQDFTETEKRGDKVRARILKSKIDEIQTGLKEKQDQFNLKKGQTTTNVTVEIIKDIVARWTGIPVSKITGSEVEKLAKLEDIMHQRLIDQEAAVTAVAQAVRRGRAGLKSTQRPIGSFIFLGPTGVGKTELAKTLADILFGQEEAMIRFDMTEYMEKHEVAKLLGAPPGYVGYEEGGKLTEAVRRRPYSVVLFDEVEKAHPDIFNILLQVLDDGRLTDNKGHTISFKNTVVICTSNIGTQVIQDEMLRNGKTEVEEPPIISSYTFSPRGREILTIGPKYFERIVKETELQQTQPEVKFLFSTFAYSPRGRQIATYGNQFFERDIPLVIPGEEDKDNNKKQNLWKKSILSDYFLGQKIDEGEIKNDKEKKIEFPKEKFDTHAISSDGVETITLKDVMYYRTSTTSKVWKTSTLIDYTKENVVANALPDAPDQQLPTDHWQTHAFSLNEEEIITLQDRYWKRKVNTNDWETGFIKDHSKDFVIEDEKPTAEENVVKTDKSEKKEKKEVQPKKEAPKFPLEFWDIHTYSPEGLELIVVGENIFYRKTTETVWKTQKLIDYVGKDFPQEKKQNTETKKPVKQEKTETAPKNWQEGMLLDYFAGTELEKTTDQNVKDIGKVDFPTQGFDTHAISQKGVEIITKGNTVFYRNATTDKIWKILTLVQLFKDHVVVNSLPDVPDEQLPTVKLKTHAYIGVDEEVISYKDRYWKRKGDTKNWETGYLKDYFTDFTIDKGAFPITHWDIHTYSSDGTEMIIVGESIWVKKSDETKWITKSLKEFYGQGFPLEKVIEEKQKVDSEVDQKKYGIVKDRVMNELRKFFRPELINRFDEVIVFEPLRFIHMMQIVKLQLKGVGKLLEDQEMGFSFTESAIKEIVRSGFDPIYGARPLRRAIQKLIENPISSLIIEGKLKQGDLIIVDFDGEGFVFNIEKVELIDVSKVSKGKKHFLCETCGNKFETEVLTSATPICSKCASVKVQEFIDEKPDKKDEKQDESKVESQLDEKEKSKDEKKGKDDTQKDDKSENTDQKLEDDKEAKQPENIVTDNETNNIKSSDKKQNGAATNGVKANGVVKKPVEPKVPVTETPQTVNQNNAPPA